MAAYKSYINSYIVKWLDFSFLMALLYFLLLLGGSNFDMIQFLFLFLLQPNNPVTMLEAHKYARN